MPTYSEFYVTHGASASDANGGGPRLGANDGPVYTTADSTVAAIPGNVIVDNTGSNWPDAQTGDFVLWDATGAANQWARVTAKAGASLTVHKTLNAGANKTTNVGGAWATVQNAATYVNITDFIDAAGNGPRVNIKNDTAFTEAITQPIFEGSATVPIVFEGYTTTAGDSWFGSGNARAEINADGIGAIDAAWYSLRDHCIYRNLYVHGNQNGDDGIYVDAYCTVENCKGLITGNSDYAIRVGTAARIVNSEASAANSTGAGIWLNSYSVAYNCLVSASAAYGVVIGYAAAVVRVVVDSPADDCFYCQSRYGSVVGCIGYGSTAGSGVRQVDGSSGYHGIIADNVWVNNNQYGIEIADWNHAYVDGNAFFGNLQGETNANHDGPGARDVTLTADPFLDGAGGDFRSNAHAGGGKLLREAGLEVPGGSGPSPDLSPFPPNARRFVAMSH